MVSPPPMHLIFEPPGNFTTDSVCVLLHNVWCVYAYNSGVELLGNDMLITPLYEILIYGQKVLTL